MNFQLLMDSSAKHFSRTPIGDRESNLHQGTVLLCAPLDKIEKVFDNHDAASRKIVFGRCHVIEGKLAGDQKVSFHTV